MRVPDTASKRSNGSVKREAAYLGDIITDILGYLVIAISKKIPKKMDNLSPLYHTWGERTAAVSAVMMNLPYWRFIDAGVMTQLRQNVGEK